MLFVDLDGVLVDFRQGVFDKFGEHLFERKGEIPWDALDHDFYANLPTIEGGVDFFRTVQKKYDARVLTGTTLLPGCFSGKAEWLVRELGLGDHWILQKATLCASNAKRLLAREGAILIDDRKKNIDQWIENEGIGIFIENRPTLETWEAILNLLEGTVYENTLHTF